MLYQPQLITFTHMGVIECFSLNIFTNNYSQQLKKKTFELETACH